MSKYDNRFFTGFGLRPAVYLSALVVTTTLSGSLKADVAAPPPSAPTTTQTNIHQAAHETPVERSLRQNYNFDPKNPIGTKIPAKQQFGNVSGGTATKTNPVRITDPYGNVSRTTVQTQTQLPANSHMNTMAAGYMYGAMAGSIVNSPNAKQAARDMANGDYGSAAVNAAASFDVFNVGSGLYGLYDEYANAKAAIADPLHKAAQAKAQAAAAAATAAHQQWQQEQGAYQQYLPDPTTGKPQVYPKLLVLDGYLNGVQIVPNWFSMSGGFFGSGYLYDVPPNKMEIGNYISNEPYDPNKFTLAETIIVTAENYNQYKDLIEQAVMAQAPQPTINDFLLNQAEIQAVIADALTKMLNNQQENTAAIKDLVNMLWANNLLNAENTQTTVTGTPAQNTILSEPYTPAGTNQAQQTQHIINQDGSITTSYIPRPDLGANSSLAPTRTRLGTPSKSKKDMDIDVDTGSSDNKQAEICTDKNDDTVMCLQAGSDDYKDLDIPHDTETIIFDKKDYFARNAACPAPLHINAFGMSMEMSYEPWCDMARGIRPIIEFLGVLTAMGIAYGAVREL